MKILVLNSGSSSQKSALFELGPECASDPVPPLWEGSLQWRGEDEELHIRNQSGAEIHRSSKAGDHRASVTSMLENLWSGPTAALQSPSEINIVGHRIVHGGPKLTAPTLITPQVKHAIEEVAAIAPLHNQAGLQGIELIEKLLPNVPQLAVFDTGFHLTLPPEAFVYPLPYSWYEREGIRRYGFHGTNHEYCANRAAWMLGRGIALLKIVTCHLGNGCSLAAIDGGQSIDTTMGFTPLEGLMMGTRSGTLDPGILIDPVRHCGYKAEDLDRVLNKESGLKGVSVVSGDMRDILAAIAQGNAQARLALDIYIRRIACGVAAVLPELGGLDVLVFTGGVGENCAEVRDGVVAQMGFLGAPVRTLVVPTREEWEIARECARLLAP